MYEYLDQPVSALAPGSRLLLWAARGWARARAAGVCPPGAIAPAFIRCGAVAVVPDLHRLLTLIEGDDGGRLSLPAPGHPTVDDLEAVLLRLWSDVLVRPARARDTLALMLGEETAEAEAALAAAGAVATGLLARGLAPEGLNRTRVP